MATLKRCAGLITYPNELSKKEGSLEIADNVVIDADDTVESRRGFADFGDSFATASDRLKQQFVYKDRLLRHYNSVIEFDSDGAGSFSSFSGTYTEPEAEVRIKGLETKRNFYFTTDEGIKKISASSAAQLSTTSGFIVNAGGVKAVDLDAKLKFSSGGFLSPQSKCAYRLVWGVRDNNNNLILGTPSARFVLENTSADISTAEEFDLLFTSATVTDYDGTASNRYVTFSSNNVDYFIWFSSTAFPDRPNDAGTVGRTAVEADIEGLTTSSSIAAAAANAIGQLSSEFSVELISSTVTVTSLEAGANLSNASSSAALTAVTTTVKNEGTITSGSEANATITFTIPQDVNTTDYFYQLYRTAPVTVTTGLTLDDIDPGDEMNLAFEGNVTSAEITAGEVTFEDITTEDFRSSSVFLYTNPNTGEGILQANEKPPIAQDVALFRNSMFFSNTKTVHRKQFNFLSVSSFTSGISDFIIGNSTTTVEYTFVGEAEVSTITCDTFANTTADSTILLNSSRDETKYYLWFDKGAGTDPAESERTSIRIDISDSVTAADISAKIKEALDLVNDFTVIDNTGSVEITNIKNGNTTDIALGTTPPGGSWAVAVTTQGDGEDTALNEVLLSSLVSVGQAIDETSRSLVKVINRDASSPVNAFYLSGADDVPGIILLENRDLQDEPFFVSTSDSAIVAKFNPELPTTETISAISIATETEITSAAHGLVTGDEIYIYSTDSTPTILGAFEVTVTGAGTFTIPFQVTSAGTTGIWYRTTFSSDNEESPNRLYYSKIDQPEAVPLLNYLDIGPKDKAILRIIALRDNLMVLKEDGIYIVTGSSAPNFGSRLLDGSTNVTAPDSAVVLGNKIYTLSTQGVITITEGGVGIISRPIENLILGVANNRFNFKNTSFGLAYESDDAYFLWMPTLTTDTIATQCYRYNVFTDTWTRWTISATCGLVSPANDILYIGSGDSNQTLQERKNEDRTDFADRDFTLSIPSDSVTDNSIGLSSTAALKLGDVLVQTQYVTASHVNRLLRKLDLDSGFDDTDYFSLHEVTQGDSIDVNLNAINAKVLADDSSGTVTSRTFSADFVTQQTEYNDLIAELNDAACDSTFKTYKESVDTVPFEAIIITKNDSTNTVTVSEDLLLLTGPIQAYEGIETDIVWAPQHFGASDTLKQVREGTILFDQSNFYSGSVSYSSDLSANFEEIDFLFQGVGFWGGNVWGEGVWGGSGNEIPLRTLVPRSKQRCRHIRVRFEHVNAREIFRILGISLEPRALSKRAYR